MTGRRTLVVVGHGMVGHKLVQALVERGAGERWEIVVFGEEPRPAHDRVHLSALFDGATAEDLSLSGDAAGHPAVRVCTGERVVAIDRSRRRVITGDGREEQYDVAVLATGSVPFVPPVPGRDLTGCFVYRTIEDVEAIRSWAADAAGTGRGMVVGGGLLGLEAANALRCCGLATEVVECAPRLMPVQVDEVGGRVLQGHIEALGVTVRVATTVVAIEAGADGNVAAVTLQAAGGAGPTERIETDVVVFSAGVRPREARGIVLSTGDAQLCGAPFRIMMHPSDARMTSVRTTVNIDEHLLAEAKVAAARSHRSLSEVVDDALRVALAHRGGGGAPAEPMKLPTAGDPARRPLVDLEDKEALAAALGDGGSPRAAG